MTMLTRAGRVLLALARDGSAPRILASKGRNPIWSRDGRAICYVPPRGNRAAPQHVADPHRWCCPEASRPALAVERSVGQPGTTGMADDAGGVYLLNVESGETTRPIGNKGIWIDRRQPPW